MRGDSMISILSRLIDPTRGDFSRAAAEAVLAINFPDADLKRVSELSDKSNAGTLTADEAAEYDSYIAAGDFLSLLKSKARLSLKEHSSAA